MALIVAIGSCRIIDMGQGTSIPISLSMLLVSLLILSASVPLVFAHMFAFLRSSG